MYTASISFPVSSVLDDGTTRTNMVKKPVKLGRFDSWQEAFAFAQSHYNKWGCKVHAVTCPPPPKEKGKEQEVANA